MNCPICEAVITRPGALIEAHEGSDETNIELRLTCPHCDAVSYTFLELHDFFPLEATNG